jgi:hypothetical protein
VARLAGELEAANVPEHLRGGLERYLVDGILPGGFLQAVLCDELEQALARFAGLPAGASVTIAAVRTFLIRFAPADAWGSVAKVSAWTATPSRLEIAESGPDVDRYREFVRRGLAAQAAIDGIVGDLSGVDEGELAHSMALELEALEAPIEVVLRPVSALQLAGLLQLALRHPSVDGPARQTALTFLAHVRAYFAEAPAVLEVLRRGDDPAFDK